MADSVTAAGKFQSTEAQISTWIERLMEALAKIGNHADVVRAQGEFLAKHPEDMSYLSVDYETARIMEKNLLHSSIPYLLFDINENNGDTSHVFMYDKKYAKIIESIPVVSYAICGDSNALENTCAAINAANPEEKKRIADVSGISERAAMMAKRIALEQGVGCCLGDYGKDLEMISTIDSEKNRSAIRRAAFRAVIADASPDLERSNEIYQSFTDNHERFTNLMNAASPDNNTYIIADADLHGTGKESGNYRYIIFHNEENPYYEIYDKGRRQTTITEQYAATSGRSVYDKLEETVLNNGRGAYSYNGELLISSISELEKKYGYNREEQIRGIFGEVSEMAAGIYSKEGRDPVLDAFRTYMFERMAGNEDGWAKMTFMETEGKKTEITEKISVEDFVRSGYWPETASKTDEAKAGCQKLLDDVCSKMEQVVSTTHHPVYRGELSEYIEDVNTMEKINNRDKKIEEISGRDVVPVRTNIGVSIGEAENFRNRKSGKDDMQFGI